MLLSFDFSQRFSFQFRASRNIIGLNRTSEQQVIVVWFFSGHQFSILSVSIYYGTQMDIRVKSYCRLPIIAACEKSCYNLWWYSWAIPWSCRAFSHWREGILYDWRFYIQHVLIKFVTRWLHRFICMKYVVLGKPGNSMLLSVVLWN